MRINTNSYARYLKWVLFAGLLNLLASGTGFGSPGLTTITLENDAFVGEDDGYTNGMGVTFSNVSQQSGDRVIPDWLSTLTRYLPVGTLENKQRGVANSFFQTMQTPGDLGTKELIVDDVPYVGLLGWRGSLHVWDSGVSDTLRLYFGLVGPYSQAGSMQKTIHGLVNAEQPNGWQHQIGNEPVFKIEAQRTWRLYRQDSEGLQYDVIALGEVGGGNYESAVKSGLALRWGYNLDFSFGTFSVLADRQANLLPLSGSKTSFLFVGYQLSFVFNDIFINGNTFRDSHSVPLKHSQNQLSAGIVWNFGAYGLVFQFSSMSPKSSVKSRRDSYGALSVTYRY